MLCNSLTTWDHYVMRKPKLIPWTEMPNQQPVVPVIPEKEPDI